MPRRPRLAVDLLYYTGKRGGTETYARQVLPRVATLWPELELIAVTGSAGHDAVTRWFPGPVRRVPLVGENRPAWALAETLAVAPFAARLGADLLWSPANFGPGGGRVPRVVTVHDVIAFDFPNPETSRVTQAVTTWIIRRAARGAVHLVTDSDASVDAVVRVLGVPRDRITATPLAGSTPSPTVDPAGVAALGVDLVRPLVLSTGNRMPHKNFAGLLRALATIPAEHRPQLVITGSHGPDPLRGLVSDLGLERDVRLLGWVSTAQLESLYQLAAVYACPSLSEGFGLPVLDAMARGCPVLANDIPVLREVGGPAARYADAAGPAVFGAALAGLVTDTDARAALRSAGTERAGTFSWDRTAEQTVQVLRDAMDGSRRSSA